MFIDDVPQFEIPFRSLPVLSDEPEGDVRTGGAGGHTELVDGFADNGVFMYADDFGMYFRMRIAGNSTASKGYTFLINTEDYFDDFGKTVINGNPGFQFEVTLQTGGGNAGINIYDWRDNSGNRLGTPLSLSVYHQRAISGSKLNAVTVNDYGYFYDWYVPWSVIDGQYGLMTPGTLFRAAAATVTSANSGISGTVSDVNGVNDSEYGSPIAAFIAAVESFPPTSAESLEKDPFPPIVVKTRTPVVLGPLFNGDNIVTGTIAEPAGTTVEVFKNGVSIGTTTSTASFTWSLSSISPVLVTTQQITARAINTADSKTLSDISNTVYVGAPGDPVLACLANSATTNFSISAFGSNNPTLSGTTTGIFSNSDIAILVYRVGTNDYGDVVLANQNLETKMVFSRANIVINSNDTWSITFSNVYGNNRQILNTYSYEAVAYSVSSGTVANIIAGTATPCVGARSNVVNTSLAAPVITGSYTEDNTTVNGTASAGTEIVFYQNGIIKGTAPIVAGAWSFSNLLLVEGDQLRALARNATGTTSPKSNTVTVTAGTIPDPPPPVQSVAPIISGEYIAGSGLTVTGFSTEQAGTTIRLYNNGTTLLGTAIVGLTGDWEVTGLTLTAGMVLSATAEASGKTVSGFSNEKTVVASLPAAPTLNNNYVRVHPELRST